MKQPILSILCAVYNHEQYLRDCLNGFVMQKTDFQFEAIVHDDASTDKSAEIIREYAEKYPNIIKPIFESENQYSKQDGSLIRIMNETMSHSSKYVAICEGDDYWTDPNKLQKQVDFLESHPEYSMCFHDVDIKAEKGRDWYNVFGKLEDRDYTGLDNIKKWSVPTCSIVCRKEAYLKRPQNPKFKMGDNVIVFTCGEYGKIRCLPQKMGVYRLTPTSWIGGQSDKIQRYKYISHYYGLIEEFEECQNESIYNLLESEYFQLLTILKREGNIIEFEKVKKDYLNFPGKANINKFNTIYRKSQLRYYFKKILGNYAITFYRKIRYRR